ncbi:TPA: lipid II-degrading bacteriocin [Klebsiella variicola subsp. variicola]|nr:lipid II-degrading bacteriocin [Klebsiella variicola subsp. variicola]
MSDTMIVVATPTPGFTYASGLTYGGGAFAGAPANGPSEGQIFFQTVLPAYQSPNLCIGQLAWMTDYINKNGVGNPKTWEVISQNVLVFCSADTALVLNPRIAVYDGFHKTKWAPSKFNFKTQSQEKFSGNVTTPIAAFGHYLWGEGKPRTVDLSTVGLKVQANQIDPVMIAVKNNAAGTYQISGNFNRNTFIDGDIPGLYLGNITMKTEGTLKIDAKGNWDYNGVVRAFNDTYDANPSTHRSKSAEDLTTLLRLTQGTPYEIRIPGELKVNGSGKK